MVRMLYTSNRRSGWQSWYLSTLLTNREQNITVSCEKYQGTQNVSFDNPQRKGSQIKRKGRQLRMVETFLIGQKDERTEINPPRYTERQQKMTDEEQNPPRWIKRKKEMSRCHVAQKQRKHQDQILLTPWKKKETARSRGFMNPLHPIEGWATDQEGYYPPRYAPSDYRGWDVVVANEDGC